MSYYPKSSGGGSSNVTRVSRFVANPAAAWIDTTAPPYDTERGRFIDDAANNNGVTTSSAPFGGWTLDESDATFTSTTPGRGELTEVYGQFSQDFNTKFWFRRNGTSGTIQLGSGARFLLYYFGEHDDGDYYSLIHPNRATGYVFRDPVRIEIQIAELLPQQ